MKNASFSTKMMLAALLLTVFVYFGMNLVAFFVDPYSTSVAYVYTDMDAVSISGFVVREEEPLAAQGEQIYFSRAEGERVSKGGAVALAYDSQQALDDANRVRGLTDQLEQLRYARALAAGIYSTVSLDQEVNAALAELHAVLALQSLAAASDAAADVRAAVLRHSYAYSGTDEIDRSIAALEEEIKNLSATLDGVTTAIRAPKSGLFSSLVDGYENILTPGSLVTMTPETYRNLTPGEARGVGKMVYGSKWYFVTLLSQEDAEKLTAGSTVTLRFQAGLDRDLTMKVERVSAADKGERLAVLSSGEDLSLTTLLRRQNAQLIFASYDGIRVPRSAVRILWEAILDEEGQPLLNEDGSEKQRQLYGVYCLWGNTARFKAVEILYQGEEYMLVRSAQEDDPLRRLRPGDEVITAAAELYDGKVIE